jgi:hypothetical protein
MFGNSFGNRPSANPASPADAGGGLQSVFNNLQQAIEQMLSRVIEQVMSRLLGSIEQSLGDVGSTVQNTAPAVPNSTMPNSTAGCGQLRTRATAGAGAAPQSHSAQPHGGTPVNTGTSQATDTSSIGQFFKTVNGWADQIGSVWNGVTSLFGKGSSLLGGLWDKAGSALGAVGSFIAGLF